MAIPDTYQRMIGSLTTRTLDRSIEWRPGSSKWEFVASFKNSSLTIRDTGDPDGTEYTVALLDSEGTEVDSFSVSVREEEEQEDFEVIGQLFRIARRQALKIDEALASIQEELDSPPDLPFE